MPNIWLIVGNVITGLILLVEHWFPWRRELSKPEAYVAGTAAIAVGQSIWVYQWGGWTSVLCLWSVPVVAGLVVMVAYGHDAHINNKIRNQVNEWKEE